MLTAQHKDATSAMRTTSGAANRAYPRRSPARRPPRRTGPRYSRRTRSLAWIRRPRGRARGSPACPPSGFSAVLGDGLVAASRRCLTVDGAGGGPVRAGFLAEGGHGGFDGGVEVVRVDGAGQAVAFGLAPHRVLELGEEQADAVGVQRLVEFFEHV